MGGGEVDKRRAAGLTGLGAALVFAAGNALWALDQPDGDASAAAIVAFYGDASGRILAGGSLSLVSIALFVFFAASVREILREREPHDLLPATAFGGALLAMAAGLGAETINMAAAARAGDGELSPELGTALFDVSYALGYAGAGVGLGILLIATGLVALRSREMLPAWLAGLAVLAGVGFLTPLSQLLLGPAVVGLAVVSARLLWLSRSARSAR
jgi:hypothetical protein